jgi:hypothetical protein
MNLNVEIQTGGGDREDLPSERRPAVPVAFERFSFRTWGVSTPCAGEPRFRYRHRVGAESVPGTL